MNPHVPCVWDQEENRRAAGNEENPEFVSYSILLLVTVFSALTQRSPRLCGFSYYTFQLTIESGDKNEKINQIWGLASLNDHDSIGRPSSCSSATISVDFNF